MPVSSAGLMKAMPIWPTVGLCHQRSGAHPGAGLCSGGAEVPGAANASGERDGETAALVHSIKEGELEDALQALNAAPYIRVFDC